MVDRSFDWPAFQRLDNAAVVDFLTSAASALCEKGILGAKDTDNLRLVLSGVSSATETRDRPLLLELDNQHADFLLTLIARFGVVGLCLNLMRHTLRGSLAEMRRTIAGLGQDLIKKSELLFNRPFVVFRGGRGQRQTLYSTAIIDFSETLDRANELLDKAQSALTLMNPHDMAAGECADTDVDLAIAKALGFAGLLSHSLPVHAEIEIKRTIVQALTLIADFAGEISEQFAANNGSESSYEVASACEWLKAECQRLDLLEFPKSESLMAWEIRRRNLSACMVSINEALQHIAKASVASLGHTAATTTPSLPESARRRVVFDLIATGVTAANAEAAATALLTYLRDHKLGPQQVLVGELARIHPQLTPRALETLVRLAGNASLMSEASAEKTSTMSRARRLAESFKRTLADVGPALLLLFMLVGCGLKPRHLQSDVVEPRPDIPFRGPGDPQEEPAALGEGETPPAQKQPVSKPSPQGEPNHGTKQP